MTPEDAVRNSVLGFGLRPLFWYRLPDGRERVAQGRKGEPIVTLVTYIEKVYPGQVTALAVSSDEGLGSRLVRVDHYRTAALLLQSERRKRRRKRKDARPFPPVIARIGGPAPSQTHGPVLEAEGDEADAIVRLRPSQPGIPWYPPDDPPQWQQEPDSRVAMTEAQEVLAHGAAVDSGRLTPRAASGEDEDMTWDWMQGPEFDWGGLVGLQDVDGGDRSCPKESVSTIQWTTPLSDLAATGDSS